MATECCNHPAFCYNYGHPTNADALPCPLFDDTNWHSGLRSGAEPSDEQRALLSVEIDALQAVADTHQKELDKLNTRLAKIQAQIDQRNSFLHCPIRRLPDEVMTDILVLLWSSSGVLTDSEIIVKGEAPADDLPALLPSSKYAPPHVCAWWRRLVFSHSSLRPYIECHIQPLPKHTPTGGDVLREDVAFGLARLPYSEMHIRLIQKNGTSCAGLNEQTLLCNRWRRAVMQNIPLGTVQDLASAHLQRLIHADLFVGPTVDDWGRELQLSPTADGRRSIFDDAPILLSFSLTIESHIDFTVRRLPFSLPWLQLQLVKVHDCPLQACLELLGECKALRYLNWWNEEDGEEDQRGHEEEGMPAGHIENASLTELTLIVYGFGTYSVRRPLEQITTPRLTTLELWCIPLDSLLPFLERSDCHITSLYLYVSVFWVSASEISALFDALPDLESLTFEYAPETEDGWVPHAEGETMDDIVESLRQGIGYEDCWPRLVVLHFLYNERCDNNFIHNFLHRCQRIESKIAKELWLETPLNPADVASLRELAEESHVEVYGLEKCAAMYKALPAFNAPSSRRDKGDQDEG
ncbi:hypothetical protein K523DRAFT_291412, partial [Schizophyllum commune Tattone D]